MEKKEIDEFQDSAQTFNLGELYDAISSFTPILKVNFALDIIPGVSNVKSLITLFLKAVCQCMSNSFVQKGNFGPTSKRWMSNIVFCCYLFHSFPTF